MYASCNLTLIGRIRSTNQIIVIISFSNLDVAPIQIDPSLIILEIDEKHLLLSIKYNLLQKACANNFLSVKLMSHQLID